MNLRRIVILSLRALVAFAAVCAVIGAWAAKPVQAHAIQFWGELSCQGGQVRTTVPPGTHVEHFSPGAPIAWTTGLYQHTTAGWVGPYFYNGNSWNQYVYSYKYWNNDNWFYNGNQPTNSVVYPVPRGAYYAVQNYAYDYRDGHWQTAWSAGDLDDTNASPAFPRRLTYCYA